MITFVTLSRNKILLSGTRAIREGSKHYNRITIITPDKFLWINHDIPYIIERDRDEIM